jgi:solute:Na+ symporter, SSS family
VDTGLTRYLNVAIVAIYMAMLIVMGLLFSRRQRTTDAYFVANRSVPGWAMGISLLATIITSVTFIAYPGASYSGNWSLITPGAMMVVVPAIAGLVIVPFFRHVVRMSAFEYFGKRFGRFVRLYSSGIFALGHLSKMAFVLYLLALTVNSMTGWSIQIVLLLSTLITVIYALIGGLEAIIWADVVQGVLLWAGVLSAAGYLLYLSPLSVSQTFAFAWRAHKFSLGEPNLNFHRPGIAVLLLYGLFFYLQKYTADQTVVQRYLAARSDREALRGILLGAVLCVPVWSLFMLVGTLLWSFYKHSADRLPAYIVKGDQVFPYFLTTNLPPGLGGLLLAALFGAGMAMLASDFNCLATIAVEDFYDNFRPQSTDRKRLRLGRICVLLSGLTACTFAWVLAHSHGAALALYYATASILAGGLAGIFLLAFLTRRANDFGAKIGIAANLVLTAWASLTVGAKPLLSLGRFRFTWHEYMIGVVGQLTLFAVGYAFSYLRSAPPQEITDLTLAGWLRTCSQSHLPIPSGSSSIRHFTTTHLPGEEPS